MSSYVPTRQTMADFERLDVLVCGSCKSVFHHVDEFKSHSSTCSKRRSTGTAATASNSAEIFEDVELDVSSEAAVAMVIWCNTIRRILVQGGVQFDDAGKYPFNSSEEIVKAILSPILQVCHPKKSLVHIGKR